jgi:hypothetical protein
MSFTAPLWLLLLLLLPVIVVLHAIAVRWRTAPVSSLVFWRDALRERKTSMSIRRILYNLTMLLELLAVAALAVALAGPRFSGRSDGGGGSTILVMDATASMQAREGATTRFDRARAAALDTVAGLRRGAGMAVILAGRSPRLLQGFTEDRAALRRVIRAARATAEPGNPADGIALALSLRDPRRGDRILFITDGAFPSIPGIDAPLPWISVHLVGGPHDNAGITALAFRKRTGGEPGYELFVAVNNDGSSERTVPLTISANGSVVIARTLTIAPGGRATESLPWTGPAEGRIEARIQTGDDFPLDDHAYAVFAPARRLRVLVVGPSTYFVQRALSSLPGVTVQAVSAPGPDLPAADVSVFVDVDPPLRETGNEVFFRAVPPNLPLTVSGTLDRPAVTGWSRTDPLLASVSLGGIAIGAALRLEPGPGFTVLAASRQSPLLLSWDQGGLKAVVAAFDPQSSDLPLRPDFPVLLANALSWFFPSWLAVQADQMQAGEPRAIASPGTDSIVVTRPDGARETLAPVGASTDFFDTDETGFYTVRAGGVTRDFAVSLVSEEETDISLRFSASPAHPDQGSSEGVPVVVWSGLAGAALGLLIAEWIAWLRASREARA